MCWVSNDRKADVRRNMYPTICAGINHIACILISHPRIAPGSTIRTNEVQGGLHTASVNGVKFVHDFCPLKRCFTISKSLNYAATAYRRKPFTLVIESKMAARPHNASKFPSNSKPIDSPSKAKEGSKIETASPVKSKPARRPREIA
ncbi:hypothetical protein CISG_03546 [Coccidioides immitis RMSCC 3703]|uniref:Uncharacterized protein n=2 Tax=Coccidioides immitis TaxID=5501 RepID=A0A0J8QLU2_COCIT|nr:hypothetical protein CIRG_03971 [Coccidioides immitis RMSCC 2394]KMU73411.1 hypothetical protein CISG_03546 [Coccidioides immitis RMSCC 3703]